MLRRPKRRVFSTKKPRFVLTTDKKDRHAEFHAILRMRVIKNLPRLLRISVEDLDYNQKTPLSEGNTKLEAEVVDSVKVVGLVGVSRIAVIDSQLESEISLREREP